jgi:hypothetical protein
MRKLNSAAQAGINTYASVQAGKNLLAKHFLHNRNPKPNWYNGCAQWTDNYLGSPYLTHVEKVEMKATDHSHSDE